MIELEPGSVLDITLQEDAQGRDCIVLSLQRHECTLNLSPHQARVLATELIMAVNRAEVRSNLRQSHNMARHERPAAAKPGPFDQVFAK
ncbi:hypothetical protein Tbd_0224 [Thiobacillus denitrificans ATCC 25259]|uniref:Uncharacterized protein n=1 Tax=Thiobacillus denitrificans (strain ATCC 25259 / T1) TaxID=292415 RepID=Q3SM73_THIDA|nr:hypothetical protein [Thiobacillus denitrificans]AAZ96177.1 hypothetical protein Tbd_0224 [Thiobacillus denitrificans ATCC 25259]